MIGQKWFGVLLKDVEISSLSIIMEQAIVLIYRRIEVVGITENANEIQQIEIGYLFP